MRDHQEKFSRAIIGLELCFKKIKLRAMQEMNVEQGKIRRINQTRIFQLNREGYNSGRENDTL